jgi:hypothetical protein
MFKRIFLFITTILTGISVSIGYNGQDLFKGTIPITRFLDWFNTAEHYVHLKGLIILDLIPAIFLIVPGRTSNGYPTCSNTGSLASIL